MEKRGQDISLTTILLMVLGVVVIVLLIWGFSSGWSSMWEKVVGFGGGKSNVDTVKQSCDLACQANQKDAFCTQKRVVNFGEKRNVWNGTETTETVGVSASCTNFTDSKWGVSVSSCPSIVC